jgi:hypothetical protein
MLESCVRAVFVSQIPNNPVQIRTLVLEQAGITDLGAAALASVLRQNAAFQVRCVFVFE